MLRRKIDTELYRWRGSHSHGPLIIAGARRVGKTTTIRELGKLYEHFVELDLERYANHRAMLADSPDPLTLIARIRDEYGRDSVVKDRTLILLDEIIACPGVWATLEKLVGFRDCDVIATASLPGNAPEQCAQLLRTPCNSRIASSKARSNCRTPHKPYQFLSATRNSAAKSKSSNVRTPCCWAIRRCGSVSRSSTNAFHHPSLPLSCTFGSNSPNQAANATVAVCRNPVIARTIA